MEGNAMWSGGASQQSVARVYAGVWPWRVAAPGWLMRALAPWLALGGQALISGAHRPSGGFAVAVGAGDVIQGVRTCDDDVRPSKAIRDLCVYAHARRNQDERSPR